MKKHWIVDHLGLHAKNDPKQKQIPAETLSLAVLKLCKIVMVEGIFFSMCDYPIKDEFMPTGGSFLQS